VTFVSNSYDFAQSFFRFCHSAQSFYVLSVILCFPQSFYDFLSYFVRHKGGGGRNIGGRGAKCRRTRRSPARRRGAKEAGTLAGEEMGGGGRGARLWRGGARYSRKRCSPVGETWGEGDRGTMSSSERSSGAGLGCAGSNGWRGGAGTRAGSIG
jgi:hypothetical protein